MDLRLLETFCAVVDHKSATGAAATLGLTQPAVSTQIARLEEEVGFALFDRNGGRLKSTSEGLLFYAEAKKALSGFDRLAQAAEQIRGGSAGRLVLASHPSAAIALLPDLVARFVRSRPGVHVRMVTRASDVVSRLLPDESFDIAIAEPPIDEVAFRVSRFRLRCVAVVPKAHPLARRKLLTPSDLDGVPMVATWRATLAYQRLKTAFADAGATLDICAETEFFASACGIVAGGGGITLVDPLSAQTFVDPNVVVREFAPAIPYEICVFHGAEPSLLARAFVEDVRVRLSQFADRGQS